MQYYCMVFTYLHACMYQYHSHRIACYSAKKQIMQLGFFLTSKQHAYFQHYSHINCMLFRQEFKSCKLNIFPGFQLRKTICISTIFHTKKKKTACYQLRIRHANWIFFQFSNQKTACIFPTSFSHKLHVI